MRCLADWTESWRAGMLKRMTDSSSGGVPSRPRVLITGATRGLGLALARELAATHDVLVGGTDPERVRVVCAEIGGEPFVADLRDPGAVDDALAGIEWLDVLVNNAGVVAVGSLESMTRTDYDSVLGVNVVSVAELTARVLPMLRQSRGLVVMINSGAGLRVGVGDVPLYVASKFALTGLTQSLRVSERGVVRFVSVHPGQVATDMQQQMAQARGIAYSARDYMQAEDVATLIADAIRAPRELTVEVLEIRPS